MAKPLTPEQVQRLMQHPTFVQLERQRWRLGLTLTVVQLAIYFGFILLVAWSPDTLCQSWSGGVMTMGIPLGIAVILSCFILSGIYVWFANGHFDDLNARLLQEVDHEHH